MPGGWDGFGASEEAAQKRPSSCCSERRARRNELASVRVTDCRLCWSGDRHQASTRTAEPIVETNDQHLDVPLHLIETISLMTIAGTGPTGEC